MQLLEISTEREPDPEGDLPEYSDKGRILFRWWVIANETPYVEVLCHDSDSSAMWLEEGMGCEYFLRREACLELELDGVYVMEGVHGETWKDYYGEVDEEWHFDFIRRASPEEEAEEALFDD